MFEWLSPYIEGNDFLSGGFILMTLGAVVAYCRKLPAQIWNFIVRQLSVSVELRNEDKIFAEFERWAEDQPFIRRVRFVVATSAKGDRVLTPAPGRHFFRFQSKIVFMLRDRNEDSIASCLPEKITLSFFPCRNQDYIREFLKKVESATAEEERFDVWLNDKWFNARRRELSSVILPKASDLMEDIRWFMDSREWYDERGLDYKRGYLLYGPPGNGKTSLVRGIASSLGLPLQVINLRELTNDSALAGHMATRHPQVVLLEDLDCHTLSKSRASIRASEDEESAPSDRGKSDSGNTTNESGMTRVTMSGLLNAIDGVIQAEGRLLFITTNYYDDLDSALLRPGRIDRIIEVGNAIPEQAEALYRRFYPSCSLEEAGDFAHHADGETSMASLQEILINKAACSRIQGGNGASLKVG